MDTKSDLSKVIRRLAEEVASGLDDSPYREIARATGALPAHVDMGGALALRPDGQIIMFDHESKKTSEPAEKWRTLALVKLARRYDELRALAPQKPYDAQDCVECSGDGFLGDFACNTCSGTGWTTDPAE